MLAAGIRATAGAADHALHAIVRAGRSAAPRTAASMTDKMLLHPVDPFPALTAIDVTVVALPGDEDATTQELIARHDLRFPVGHGVGASAIADVPAPS